VQPFLTLLLLLLPLQIAEHKRAVDKMLEEKHAMYEAARAEEEQQEAARCVPATGGNLLCLAGITATLACVVAAVCALMLQVARSPGHLKGFHLPKDWISAGNYRVWKAGCWPCMPHVHVVMHQRVNVTQAC
jgi:hypothetical protein